MPMSLETKGIQEMQGKLKLLQQLLIDEAVREAARAGAAVILAEAQARAPVRIEPPTPESTSLPPGAIKASLRITMAKVKDGRVTAMIGPGKKIKGLVASVEYGHRIVKGGWNRILAKGTKGPGTVWGYVPAHSFLRTAFDQSAAPAIAAASDVMREELRKVLD